MTRHHRRDQGVCRFITGGIRGYADYTYFLFLLGHLAPFMHQYSGWSTFPRTDIAWLELFAAFVAIDFFAARSPGRYVILYSDNTNVVAWLSRRRSPNPYVCTLVSAIERLKYKFLFKLSTWYISTNFNVSADLLSRNIITLRFLDCVTRVHPNLARLCSYLHISEIWHQWSNTVPSSMFPS